MALKLDPPRAYWEQALTGRLMYTEPSMAEQGWRRERAARVWQAMQALWFAAYTYEWGVTDGKECTKPKYRPVDNTK
jgi:hypothetical protein